ncbi:MAG: Gfo/Idh/MocA family oxidoreductase [SAR202 cluster bacterium]|nr:Gfo/Idh/MocA family oxidoreductase [SAR202 cluster bacterium]
MTLELKVAIAGIGQRGLQHLENLLELENKGIVKIQALIDPFHGNLLEANIQQKIPKYSQKDYRLFTDFQEFLDNEKVDAIWFSIPPNQHQKEIIETANRGIAIFAEKPQSLFLDEVNEMSDAIEKNNVKTIVGFQLRYDPWYQTVKSYLNDKWVPSISMFHAGGIESHGTKYTHTEKLGGPENRIWTANRLWSGTSMVEAGIHQTDLMRFWTNDDIKWVQAAYTERPLHLHSNEGDNPIAYHVIYGFKKGGIANLIFLRPANVMYQERFDYILTTHSILKFEDDLVAYENYNPTTKKNNRTILATGPHTEPMGRRNTFEISKAFAESITTNNSKLRLTSFQNSINSLSAVLAANVSHTLNGERILLEDFCNHPKFSKYRKKPTPNN